MKAADTLELRIRRGDRWERFLVAHKPRMTLATALDRLALDPVTADGRRVEPVLYTLGCLPIACGACTLLINGRPAGACTTTLGSASPKGKPITLAPLAKLPLLRDLLVDRSRLRQAATRLAAWPEAPADAGDDGAAANAGALARRHELARCIDCGACIEACPETRLRGGFVGAAAVAQSELWRPHAGARLPAATRALTLPGGIHECAHAHNCVEVCPERIALDDALARAARDATAELWRMVTRGR